MKNLKINIQELALLMGTKPAQVSTYFNSYCIVNDITYKRGMELPLVDLGKHMKVDLVKKADHIRENYLKYSDVRVKVLNDKKGVLTNKFKTPLTALKKFLKQEDIDLILGNWNTKNQQLKNQLNFL